MGSLREEPLEVELAWAKGGGWPRVPCSHFSSHENHNVASVQLSGFDGSLFGDHLIWA